MSPAIFANRPDASSPSLCHDQRVLQNRQVGSLHSRRAILQPDTEQPGAESVDAKAAAIAQNFYPASGKISRNPGVGAGYRFAVGREKLIACVQFRRLRLLRSHALDVNVDERQHRTVATFVRNTLQTAVDEFSLARAEADQLFVEAGFVDSLNLILFIELFFEVRGRAVGNVNERFFFLVVSLTDATFVCSVLVPLVVRA